MVTLGEVVTRRGPGQKASGVFLYRYVLFVSCHQAANLHMIWIFFLVSILLQYKVKHTKEHQIQFCFS